MNYTTIVVQAEADDDGRSRVELALGLAARFDATLVGVAARAQIPLMTVPGTLPGIGSLLADEEQGIHTALDAAERQSRALAAATHARINWQSTIADPVAMLAREARTADLVAVGRRPERAGAGRSRHADPGDVLMRAGRPILVVPPGVSSLKTDHVKVGHAGCSGALAWSATRPDRALGPPGGVGDRAVTSSLS